jgi:hypothetical protein
MPGVKLGSKTFDVDPVGDDSYRRWHSEIDAWNIGVTAAECSVLAARIKTGGRVKKLNLVSFISVVFYFLNSAEPQFFCRAATTSAPMALVTLQRLCEQTAPWRR